MGQENISLNRDKVGSPSFSVKALA